MRQDERAPFVVALQQAREAAYPPGEFVGQESFLRATEIRRLANRAGIGPGTSVLDVCCGVGGPGRLVTADFGCRYLGLDYSASTVDLAREMARNLPCRFEQAHVPPLPDGRFDVVLLLETMLAFPDKRALLGEVARVLEPGGRFAFTVEAGPPLTPAEQSQMPDADTVWLVEEAELAGLLEDAGLSLTWHQEWTASHAAVATRLLQSFAAYSAEIAEGIGERALAELVDAHALWSDWLGGGRVRKYAGVAERQ